MVPKTTAVLISFLQVFCASAIFSLQLCNTQCVSSPACHYVDLGAREQGGGHWISVSWIWHICITDTIWNRAVHTKHKFFLKFRSCPKKAHVYYFVIFKGLWLLFSVGTWGGLAFVPFGQYRKQNVISQHCFLLLSIVLKGNTATEAK